MSNITVHLMTGEEVIKEYFKHEGRAGGSYTKKAIFQDGWLIVSDEWGKKIVYPAHRVYKVEIDE